MGFYSPSTIDMQQWEKATADVRAFAQRIRENPNLLKDPSFRAEWEKSKAVADYSTMAQLKASRDNMLLRMKNTEQLKATNQYNPLLEEHNLESLKNYSTKATGVYTDIGATPYISTSTLAAGIANSIDDEIIGEYTHPYTGQRIVKLGKDPEKIRAMVENMFNSGDIQLGHYRQIYNHEKKQQGKDVNDPNFRKWLTDKIMADMAPHLTGNKEQAIGVAPRVSGTGSRGLTVDSDQDYGPDLSREEGYRLEL